MGLGKLGKHDAMRRNRCDAIDATDDDDADGVMMVVMMMIMVVLVMVVLEPHPCHCENGSLPFLSSHTQTHIHTPHHTHTHHTYTPHIHTTPTHAHHNHTTSVDCGKFPKNWKNICE